MPGSGSGIRNLDIFFFYNDPLGRLDSYQRFDFFEPETVAGACTRGERKVAVLANSPDDRYTWSDVNSYQGLNMLTADLHREDPAYPILRGEGVVQAGDDAMAHIGLEPLLCEVVLSSLKVDFSERSYRDAELSDFRVYLTNVNCRRQIFGPEGRPVDIVNRGGLRENDMESMAHPEMLVSSLEELPQSFYCYPNLSAQESLGAPFTRLVIEGKVDGETWYWPLDIGREEEPPGLQGGMSYSFDVTLTRLGVKDPDTPVGGVSADLSLEISPWKDYADRYIDY